MTKKVPETPTENVPVKKEKLLKVSAMESFVDGNLREDFESLGYEVDWKMNEVRELPHWLIKRCVNSGAKLQAEDGRELSLE